MKAILPVHYGGRPCDLDALGALAREHGLRVVEDAAHALPCRSKGRMIGTVGDVTVFSFYATKTITTGEGGMAVTADERLAARMRVMRLHGIDREVWSRYSGDKPAWYYEVVAPGFKYNLTDVAAAIGLGQLARCDAMHARRTAIAHAYRAAFAAETRLVLPGDVDAAAGDVHAWHLFPVRLAGVDRDRFVRALSARGVGTSVHFIPLHLHPYWRDRYGFAPEAFPVALRSFRASVSLPIYTRMTDGDVGRVIEAVRAGLDEAAL